MSAQPSRSTSQGKADTTMGDESRFLAEVLRCEAEAIDRIANEITASDPGGEASHWSEAVKLIADCSGHVVVSGMGKSGLIGAKISATFSSLGLPSHVIHPAEAVHGDLGRIRKDDVVLLLSYSGNTEEVLNLATILKADGVCRIGISCNHDTHLSKLCDTHLALGDLEEAGPVGLAPTTSTTATLACGDALALAASKRRDFSEDDFHRHHPGGMLGAGLRQVSDVMRFRAGEELPVVSHELTVEEALAVAWNERSELRRAGAIILIDDQGLLSGIFTDGDLRRLVMNDREALAQPISNVMTRHPRSLLATDRVRDARQLVAEHRIDEIPVVDAEGHPVGLVDVQDLVTMKIVQE
ncbi:MAG: KpsF/GutQ family sugar-phosphate isomerase [Phycisphaerae bacterium]|nr:KpsF/GutQ family sugar-phosphate isomerase [Phycisphaerae bacterium]